jgi:DNA repair exonuclease SbcCD nuclease subunit
MNECLNAFEWTYKVAAERGIKHVVDLGDVFHERGHVDVHTHSEVYGIARHYHRKAGITTTWILGNHDMYFRFDTRSSSIVSFESLGPVVSRPGKVQIGDFECDCMPYVEKAPVAAMREAFPVSERNRILFFHGAVEGAVMNAATGKKREPEPADDEDIHEEEIGEAISPDAMDGWKLAMGGHYHMPQDVTISPCHVMYVGSILQHCFTDAGDKKRVCVVDLESLEIEDIFNDLSPRFVTLDLDRSPEFPEDVEWRDTRVRLLTSEPSSSEVRATRARIKEAGAISVIVQPRRKNRIDTDVHRTGISQAAAWVRDGASMVRRYVKLQSPEDLDRDKLVKIGMEIVEAASSNIILDAGSRDESIN